MSEAEKCYLCGADCSVRGLSAAHLISLYECQYCGTYGLDRRAGVNYRSKTLAKLRAACVAAERRWQGLDGYIIFTEECGEDVLGFPTITMDSLVESYPKTATALLDRSLLSLSRMVDHPGGKITLAQDRPTSLFSRTPTELRYVMGQFYEMGFVKPHIPPTYNGTPPLQVVVEALLRSDGFYIQANGWRRIDELTRTSPGGRPQGFVAMWFNEETDEFYNKGIKPAIKEDCNCKCMKIDEVEHNNKICDEIIAEIRRSQFVVADFTAGCCKMCDTCEHDEHEEKCEDKVRPRGGVYFEAGFALGLNIPVIWTVHQDQIGCVHFDTEHYNHILYEDAEDLRKKLTNRIRATIPLGKADEK